MKRFSTQIGLAIVGIVAFSLLGLLRFQSIHAAAQNITLSPTSVDASVNPGETKTGSVQIINSGDSPFTYTTYVSPYRVVGEDYQQQFTLLPGAPDPTSWLQLKTGAHSLDSHKLSDIDYTLHVPKGTPAGGYYFVLFAETKAAANANGVVITDRVGEIFYISVSGDTVQKGSVLSWTAAGLQKPPVHGAVRITNEGTSHFLSTTHVVAKDLFGHTKFTFDSQKQVLPHTVRRIAIDWDKAPGLGFFKLSGTVKILNKTEVLPTRYVLVMSIEMRVIFAILLIGLLICITLAVRRRRHGHQFKVRR